MNTPGDGFPSGSDGGGWNPPSGGDSGDGGGWPPSPPPPPPGNDPTGSGWAPPPPPGGDPTGSGWAPPPPPPGGGWSSGPAGPGGGPPPNNLVWAILSTLFCCLPLGIVSIVFAAQVNTKYQAGDYAGAVEASRKAKNFAIGAAAVGVVVLVIYIGAILFFGIASSSFGSFDY